MAFVLGALSPFKGCKLDERRKTLVLPPLFCVFGVILGLTGLGAGIFASFALIYFVENWKVTPLSLLFVTAGSFLSSLGHLYTKASTVLYENMLILFFTSFFVSLILVKRNIVIEKKTRKAFLVVLLVSLGFQRFISEN